MSQPFSAPENRHHLLLTEAHQVNEFLDARLVGAEVPEGHRSALAENVLALAMQARAWEPAHVVAFFDSQRSGINKMMSALPLTDEGAGKLFITKAAAEAMIAQCVADGSMNDDAASRAAGLFAFLVGHNWPPHFVAALVLADGGIPAQQALTLFGSHPAISRPLRNPPD